MSGTVTTFQEKEKEKSKFPADFWVTMLSVLLCDGEEFLGKGKGLDF